MKDFILASSSPRRLELLAQIGVAPKAVIPASIPEDKNPKETMKQYALRMAYEKALAVSKTHPGTAVLAADTVVSCGLRLLAKPQNRDDAAAHLKLLSGRRHQVHGGVCLIAADGKISRKYVKSVVKFKVLAPEDIKEYLASDEWEGKAGAYAVQGLAAKFINYIGGSYSNIVGLPLFEAANLLKEVKNADA